MGATEFRDFIRDTYGYLEQLKLKTTSVGYDLSESSGGGGYGPKSPINDAFMHQLDDECRSIGNVASYCIDAGSVPQVQLTGLRWSRHGGCVGQRGKISAVFPVLSHMSAYAADILDTEGVDRYLSQWFILRNGIVMEGEIIRHGTRHMIPNEALGEWIDERQASKLSGRGVETIRKWRQDDRVRSVSNDYGVLLLKGDIVAMTRQFNETLARNRGKIA